MTTSGINVDVYQEQPLPENWEIEEVLGDLIMAEFIDCSADGSEILKGGIWVKLDVTTRVWRVAKIIKTGPACSDRLKVGDLIMFPNDKGLKAACIPDKKGKKKFVVFINEERIFGKCKAVKQDAKK